MGVSAPGMLTFLALCAARMTGNSSEGVTINSAPAAMALAQVFRSKTVPAPMRARLPKRRATSPSTRRAFGTVMVISATPTPLATIASAAANAISAVGARTIGISPTSRIFSSALFLDQAISNLSFLAAR